MSQHERFRYKSIEELRDAISELGLAIPVENSPETLRTELDVGDVKLPNRFVVHPMEGFDADPQGRPQRLSFRRYRRYAEGGAALIWCEATSVLYEGRSNPGQFWLHEDSAETFRELVRQTKTAGQEKNGSAPVMILQLTHSGRYSKPSGLPEPIIAHRSPILDPVHNLDSDYPVVSDDYLDSLQDTFANAARLAAEAGFDGVDIKSCHRYLVAELHASFTREGRYGGSYENRTRLLRETATRIKEQNPKIWVTTRMNAFDGIEYPYGFGVSEEDKLNHDLTEPKQLVTDLKEATTLPILNLSIGNPYFNPHLNRPYDFPITGGQSPDEHPLEGIERFLHVTGEMQQAHPDVSIIGTGYAWLRHLMPYVAEGAVQRGWTTMIGQGRGSFAYPDSVNDLLQNGEMDPKKTCITCSACTQIMRDGGKTGCVVRDSEVYGPLYRQAHRYSVPRLKQEAERCRDCEQPTCSHGCPAQIDIPGFIRAFREDDYETAYAMLAEKNALPEMCGLVCPADEQCEGHCLENIFSLKPLPIQDIQTVVARTARLKGITGIFLPEQTNGKSVAVVGGGPAGLACTIRLLQKGCNVVVYEKDYQLGGTPDDLIPDQRFTDSQDEVQARIAPALEAGRLEIHSGCELGKDFSLEELKSEYDSVFLGFGLTESISLSGERIRGVEDALVFLREMKAGEKEEIPESVAVIGGGNTAMDAAYTAKTAGAKDVYILYRRSFLEMPAWRSERDRCLEAGVNFLILTQPHEYEKDEQRNLAGVKVVRTKLGKADSSGRRRPEPVEGSETTLKVNLAVEAIGQTLDPTLREALATVGFTDKGLVAVQENSYETAEPNVFAGGDIVNGGTTAVQGISDGMKAAEEIHQTLT